MRIANVDGDHGEQPAAGRQRGKVGKHPEHLLAAEVGQIAGFAQLGVGERGDENVDVVGDRHAQQHVAIADAGLGQRQAQLGLAQGRQPVHGRFVAGDGHVGRGHLREPPMGGRPGRYGCPHACRSADPSLETRSAGDCQGALEQAARGEDEGVVAGLADELDRGGQAVLRRAARKRERGRADRVPRQRELDHALA
jgi:hypothetical protein